MDAGAQGIIMSAGYPDFKIDQRKIDFTMRMKDQVFNRKYGNYFSFEGVSGHVCTSEYYDGKFPYYHEQIESHSII